MKQGCLNGLYLDAGQANKLDVQVYDTNCIVVKHDTRKQCASSVMSNVPKIVCRFDTNDGCNDPLDDVEKDEDASLKWWT